MAIKKTLNFLIWYSKDNLFFHTILDKEVFWIFFQLSKVTPISLTNILRKAKLLKGIDIFINADYCRDTVGYNKEL